jgi:hypothetical protein
LAPIHKPLTVLPIINHVLGIGPVALSRSLHIVYGVTVTYIIALAQALLSHMIGGGGMESLKNPWRLNYVAMMSLTSLIG